MKFTFFYEDAQAHTKQIESAGCCDVTSDGIGNANVEHDVPACAPGTPPEKCTYVAESVQPLGRFSSNYSIHPNGHDLVDLVFAAPHLHYAGISIELIDYETKKTICEVHRNIDNTAGVVYGHGDTAGDEDGYLVGLTPCVWGTNASRFRRDHKMLTRAVYNATKNHTGVMSLWLAQVSAVQKQEGPMLI